MRRLIWNRAIFLRRGSGKEKNDGHTNGVRRDARSSL